MLRHLYERGNAAMFPTTALGRGGLRGSVAWDMLLYLYLQELTAQTVTAS